MTAQPSSQSDSVVSVERVNGRSAIVLACEHASAHIPTDLNHLGVAKADRESHAAWDPGALAVARLLSQRFDAALVASTVSRLVYDCNRPPSAPDAMPAQSERIAIPGNANLTPEQRQARARTYYYPFRATLAQTLGSQPAPVLVTLHSFTPTYNGKHRPVEVGILHDEDTRLADAMMHAARASSWDVQRNQPYGPEHGVTHTLKEHALAAGHLNVMIEIRNDLLKTDNDVARMAETIGNWLEDALTTLGAEGQAA